jgi:hypothetical protein
MKFLTAFAKRMLDALVRPGDIAVETHRDGEPKLAHSALLRIPC